jgi:hypothetical protein
MNGRAIDHRFGASTNGTSAPISATRCSARATPVGIGYVSALLLRHVSSSCVPSAAEPADDAYRCAPARQNAINNAATPTGTSAVNPSDARGRRRITGIEALALISGEPATMRR